MKKSFTAKTKLWKVMKICAVQGVIAMVLVGVSMAHDDYAQLLNKKVTLDLKEVTIEKALKEIEKVAKVKFVYSQDQLHLDENVSFRADHQTLHDLLDKILLPYQIKYKVHEKESTITLRKKSEEPQGMLKETEDDAIKATGKDTDEKTGEPLAGVNVIIKG